MQESHVSGSIVIPEFRERDDANDRSNKEFTQHSGRNLYPVLRKFLPNSYLGDSVTQEEENKTAWICKPASTQKVGRRVVRHFQSIARHVATDQSVG